MTITKRNELITLYELWDTKTFPSHAPEEIDIILDWLSEQG